MLKRTTTTDSFYMADDSGSAAAVADGVGAHTDEDLGYKTPDQKGWSYIQLIYNLPCVFKRFFAEKTAQRDSSVAFLSRNGMRNVEKLQSHPRPSTRS